MTWFREGCKQLAHSELDWRVYRRASKAVQCPVSNGLGERFSKKLQAAIPEAMQSARLDWACFERPHFKRALDYTHAFML